MQSPPSLRRGSAGSLCSDAEDANNLPSPSRSHASTLAASRRLDPRLWPQKLTAENENPARRGRKGEVSGALASPCSIGFSRGASSAIGALRRSPGTPQPGLFLLARYSCPMQREMEILD
jgi:hypothetical protein